MTLRTHVALEETSGSPSELILPLPPVDDCLPTKSADEKGPIGTYLKRLCTQGRICEEIESCGCCVRTVLKESVEREEDGKVEGHFVGSTHDVESCDSLFSPWDF